MIRSFEETAFSTAHFSQVDRPSGRVYTWHCITRVVNRLEENNFEERDLMNGERVRLARKRAGLSLRGLAKEMGDLVTAQAIGKYERNEMIPSSEVLIALGKALSV